tara:strand:- start:1284 stop:1976 length:693 start_codon:yes stop_codon:yes gene_type:complete
MQQAEFNHNDFADTAEADKSLMVKFFYKERPDSTKSEELGRPVFKEVAYIELRVAGQRDVQACRPATVADKQRFPRHFDAFERRVEAPTEGMPLSEWPQITRTQAEELAFLNVKTVEQMATVKDSNISNMMGGYGLREKAQKWLEVNDKQSVDREKEELRGQVAELQAQMRKLLEQKAAPMSVQTEIQTDLFNTPIALQSELDEETDPNAAIPVPAAPAGRAKRKSRAKK